MDVARQLALAAAKWRESAPSVTSNQPFWRTVPASQGREPYVSSIVIDGLSEEDFRRSVQNRLREGKASSTIMRLRTLLTPYAGPGGILPERFLTVEATDLELSGWDKLGEAVARHDRPGRPVNAVSIAFGWPGDELPVPDPDGNLPPVLETSYFNDDAFPFSHSSRDDLLDGYSFDGCTWSGDPEATDNALTLEGIDDLNAALAALEAKLLASDEPEEADLRAGSLGASLLSVLLLQTVTLRTERDGLPRPLCVTAGSNGVYPYFDTPVAGMPAEVIAANEVAEDVVPAGQDVPVPRYSSLLLTGIPRARKRAVLVLEETGDEMAVRLAGLRNLHHPEREDGAGQHDEGAAPVDAPTEPAVLGEPAAPEQPEPVLGEPNGGLLLAKKPAKHSGDFRDMLGPRDSDLQQRLDNLLAGSILPAAAPAVPDLPVPAEPVEQAWSEPPEQLVPSSSEPAQWHDDVVAEAPHDPWLDEEFNDLPMERRRDRWWAGVKAWLSNLVP